MTHFGNCASIIPPALLGKVLWLYRSIVVTWASFYMRAVPVAQFNWHAIPEHEKKRRQHSADPAYSPTMAGGLFAIDRAFFQKLGTYDDGFDIWGGENLELSFKVWRDTCSIDCIESTSPFSLDVDVWRNVGNHSVQSRRTHFPKTLALQVAQRSQRPQAQQRPLGRSLAGWIFRVLLPTNRARPGNRLHYSLAYMSFS